MSPELEKLVWSEMQNEAQRQVLKCFADALNSWRLDGDAAARFAKELKMENAVVEAARKNLLVWEMYLNGIAEAGDAEEKSKRRRKRV